MDWFLYDNHLRHERVKRQMLDHYDENLFNKKSELISKRREEVKVPAKSAERK